MARIKFYNEETGKWEYADKALSVVTPEIATDDDVLDLLRECDVVTPITDSNGLIFINNQNEIYVL